MSAILQIVRGLIMDIYRKMDKATELVSVIVVQDKEKNIIGRIIFKFPRDGAGRVHVFIQEYGHQAIHGHAGGYGYDKQGAALQNAYIKYINSEEVGDSKLYKALEHITYNGEWMTIMKENGYNLLNVI